MSSGPVGYVDTTLRDLAAHPWGTAIGTEEIAAVADSLASSGAVAIEALDSFSARGALDGRGESPWDRLRAAVRAARSVPVGVVVAGRTLLGSHPLDADSARRLVACACESGARRVRAVDALNEAEALLPLAEAAISGGAEFVPTLVLGPVPESIDPLWLEEAKALAGLPGVTKLCLVDRAGHLRPSALAAIVPRIMEVTGLPIELSLVGPGGLAPVAAVEGVEAGASAVQAAVGAAALAAGRSSVETLRAALSGGPRELICDRTLINQLSSTVWSLIPPDRLRQAQATESGPVLGVPLDLGAGLYSRLARLGMMDRLIDVAGEVVVIAREVGNVTLAHPIGAAVVAQAVRHVVDGERWGDVEPTLVGTVRGDYGRLRGEVDPAVRGAVDAAPAPSAADLEILSGPEAAGLSEEDRLLAEMFPESSGRLFSRRLSLVGEATDGLTAPSVDRGLIETLVDVVENSGEAEVSVEVGGARVTVRRSGPSAGAPRSAASGADSPSEGAADDALVRVESPIVGTFYRASAPTSPPYVQEGDRVTEGQTLCIIEAMKIFNEIIAETAGTIRQIAVQNAEAVEYGTLLFLIEP